MHKDAQASRHSFESDSTSNSSSSSDSDDDAPLAALKRPPLGNRTNSSQSSSPQQMRKPLIDLNSKSNPITGRPVAESSASERDRTRSTLISPTNINGRLSRLTTEAGLGNHRKASASKSEDNLSRDASASTSTLQTITKLASPISSDTVTPPIRTTSPEPLTPKAAKAFDSPSPPASVLTPRFAYDQSDSGRRSRPENRQPESPKPRPSVSQEKLKPSTPLHPTQTSSPSPRPNVITPGIRTSSLSYSSSVFSDSSSSKQMDELRPVPIKTRSTDDHGFRVVSRPLKSNSTATSPTTSSSDGQSVQSQPRSMHSPGHRQTPSTSSTRTQSTIAAIKTTPLTPPSHHGNLSHSSSPATSMPATRSAHNLQSPPQRAFLSSGKRTDSPSSSTGGSSNGKAPLTPRDGSDYSIPDVSKSSDSPSSSSISTAPASAMKGGRGHIKRASVSFQESMDYDQDETIRGRRSGGTGMRKTDDMSTEERETRLRERRRGEAKAAIEVCHSNFLLYS